MFRRSLKHRTTTFEWDTPTDNPLAQDALRPTVHIHHTTCSINDAGPSLSLLWLHPQKHHIIYQEDYLLHQMGLEPEVDNGLGGAGPLSDDDAADDVVDPEYQEHLDEDAAGLPKPRQKRTQVCYALDATDFALIFLHRRIHCGRGWMSKRSFSLSSCAEMAVAAEAHNVPVAMMLLASFVARTVTAVQWYARNVQFISTNLTPFIALRYM